MLQLIYKELERRAKNYCRTMEREQKWIPHTGVKHQGTISLRSTSDSLPTISSSVECDARISNHFPSFCLKKLPAVRARRLVSSGLSIPAILQRNARRRIVVTSSTRRWY